MQYSRYHIELPLEHVRVATMSDIKPTPRTEKLPLEHVRVATRWCSPPSFIQSMLPLEHVRVATLLVMLG